MGRRKPKRRRTTLERLNRRRMNKDFEAKVKAYFLIQISYFSRPTGTMVLFCSESFPISNITLPAYILCELIPQTER